MYDDEHCRRRYRELMGQRPDLFTNPAECPTQVVVDPIAIADVQRVVAARRKAEGYDARDVRVGVLAEDHYIGVVIRDAVRFSDGEPGLYNRVVATGGVVALPILGDDLALIRIYRHPPRRWFLEAPQGLLAPGTDAARQAARELEEEMGAQVRHITPLGHLYTSTALTSERLTLFAAQIEGTGKPQLSEGIEAIERIAKSDIDQYIADGTICDGPTISVIARARIKGIL
ncbi:MAG TPA: NUDIX hydrolase [Pseudolabrys sp.]|nr:NUDIX hydrolase [Pseudolabrys sp.]